MKIKVILLAAATSGLLAAAGYGQENATAGIDADFYLQQAEAIRGRHQSSGVAASLPCEEACMAYREAVYAAATNELRLRTDVRRRAYEWHHRSTVFIFVLVCLIVLAGLGLSFMEFAKGMGQGAKAEGRQGTGGSVNEAGDAAAGRHRFKLGLDGVEASSSLVGLMIFIASIAFFYLYLAYVYEIKTESAPAVEMRDREADGS